MTSGEPVMLSRALSGRSRPLLLDLFCCEGGASYGYSLAGFDVVGVDNKPQPRYPFEFHQDDALIFLARHWRSFDVIAASPPRQRFSKAQRIQGNHHPDLIAPTRRALQATNRPYIIENVEDAADELRNPTTLCGGMFSLRTYRHRLFETNGFWWGAPSHPRHLAPNAKMGRPVTEREFMHIVGNFSDVTLARQIMGMPWASRNALSEAVPPVYTQYIGGHIHRFLQRRDIETDAARGEAVRPWH